MKKKFVGDFLALGLFLIGIALFFTFINQSGIIKFFGLSGSIIIIMVETVFLWQSWVRRWLS